eukprot:scaffold62451_cov28-Tisochrysis_lutea.AAC.2
MRTSLLRRGGSWSMGLPEASTVSFVRRSMRGRSILCSSASRPGCAIACDHSPIDSAGPGTRRKWRSEKSSPTQF